MENLEYLKSLLDIHPELQYEIIEQYWTTDFLRFYIARPITTSARKQPR